MSLTEKQKNLLRWIVKEVRAGNLTEYSIVYGMTTSDGYTWIGYKGSDIWPDVELTTLDILEKYDYVIWQKKSPNQYKGSLTQKAYDAVDSNFNEPDRSAIRHLIPLTEVEHLDSKLWERVRISVSAGGDDPKAWDSAVRDATVVLEERLRQLGKIDSFNPKASHG